MALLFLSSASSYRQSYFLEWCCGYAGHRGASFFPANGLVTHGESEWRKLQIA